MTEILNDLSRLPASDTTAEPLGVAEEDGELRRESPPGTPRWVKAFGIALVILMLVFAGLHLTGNAPMGIHGTTATEHGMQLP